MRRGQRLEYFTAYDRYFHLGDRIVNLDYGKIDNDLREHPLCDASTRSSVV